MAVGQPSQYQGTQGTSDRMEPKHCSGRGGNRDFKLAKRPIQLCEIQRCKRGDERHGQVGQKHEGVKAGNIGPLQQVEQPDKRCAQAPDRVRGPLFRQQEQNQYAGGNHETAIEPETRPVAQQVADDAAHHGPCRKPGQPGRRNPAQRLSPEPGRHVGRYVGTRSGHDPGGEPLGQAQHEQLLDRGHEGHGGHDQTAYHCRPQNHQATPKAVANHAPYRRYHHHGEPLGSNHQANPQRDVNRQGGVQLLHEKRQERHDDGESQRGQELGRTDNERAPTPGVHQGFAAGCPRELRAYPVESRNRTAAQPENRGGIRDGWNQVRLRIGPTAAARSSRDA